MVRPARLWRLHFVSRCFEQGTTSSPGARAVGSSHQQVGHGKEMVLLVGCVVVSITSLAPSLSATQTHECPYANSITNHLPHPSQMPPDPDTSPTQSPMQPLHFSPSSILCIITLIPPCFASAATLNASIASSSLKRCVTNLLKSMTPPFSSRMARGQVLE